MQKKHLQTLNTMSSRLKRRSSIGFPGANRQNDTAQSDEVHINSVF